MRGQLPFNSVDYSPLLRAALVNLDRWATDGTPAPASRHPSLAEGTAVETRELLPRFKQVPGVPVPDEPTRAMRLDYGPEQHLGRTTTLPAIQGEEYPALVSDVDESFNEVAGIRLPDLTVPVATYTGWNPRHPDIGNPGLMIGITGGLAGWTLPLPNTREDREAAGDPRPSIEESYDSKDDYLGRVRDAAESLVETATCCREDVEGIVDRAGEKWDWATSG